MTKQRLDKALVERGLVDGHHKAQALIMAGKVRVNDQPVLKAGIPVSDDDDVVVAQPDHPYVGRGGLKLEAALKAWPIDPTDKVCADVGASTGGFTDCLLQHGAASVYAIDVGQAQLANKLRLDQRVINLEKTHVKDVARLPEPVSLVTIDVSFISLRRVLPHVTDWLTLQHDIVALFKPQFEAGRELAGQYKGVIKDEAIRQQLLDEFAVWAEGESFEVRGIEPSPIQGDKGNREFLVWMQVR